MSRMSNQIVYRQRMLLAGMAAATGTLTGKRLEYPGAVRLMGEQVARLMLLKGDEPARHYPAQAKLDGVDGIVIVDLLVNEAGQVQEAAVLSESPPGQGFGLAALDTAKTYEFANTVKKPVLMALTIEFLP
jgi:TonB family protein